MANNNNNNNDTNVVINFDESDEEPTEWKTDRDTIPRCETCLTYTNRLENLEEIVRDLVGQRRALRINLRSANSTIRALGQQEERWAEEVVQHDLRADHAERQLRYEQHLNRQLGMSHMVEVMERYRNQRRSENYDALWTLFSVPRYRDHQWIILLVKGFLLED